MTILKARGHNSARLLLLLMAVLMISTYATAQTGFHSGMIKRSVIAIEDSNVYMVYKGSPSFKRKHTGKKIIEILDEHFARSIRVTEKLT